jgi:hypothetical protein
MTKSGCNVFHSSSSSQQLSRQVSVALQYANNNNDDDDGDDDKKTTKMIRQATYVKRSTLRLIRVTVPLENQSGLNFECVSVFLS